MRGQTDNGFEFEIDIEKLKEWDFIELLQMADTGSDTEKVSAMVNLVKYTFGDDYRRFIDFVKNKHNGSAQIEFVKDEFTDVLNSCKELKK